MTEPLDLPPVEPDEAEAIVAELLQARDEVPPTDASSAGCVVAIVSIIAIVLIPFVERALDLSSGVLFGVGASLWLVAILGGAVGIFGGYKSGRSEARLNRRIGRIVSDSSEDGSVRLAETVRLLEGAHVSRGPRTVPAFDVPEVASRLGAALPYVRRVERFLVDRQEIHPVFTAEQPRST